MSRKIEDEHLEEIIKNLLKENNLTKKRAWKLTKKVCKKYSLEKMPTNVDILAKCGGEEKRLLRNVLLTKPVRTISGVTIITVVPEPGECPGECIYCPRGENSPQSYIGTEPAIMRAKHNDYDPYQQVRNRIEQYKMMGHPTDKIQIIIIGGTFLARNKEYKRKFIKRIFDSMNGVDSATLEDAKKMNEKSDNRCIGLIIESRPDYCKKDHIDEMLNYGTTMVELGVQSIYPDVLDKCRRNHTIKDVTESTKLLKDSGFKVNYHMMPGLPGVDFENDLKQMRKIFGNSNFRPDALKIYPTLVVKGTELYEMWKRGEYTPLDTDTAVKLLSKVMLYIPKYCRVVRVQRTISVDEIEKGVDKSNLRELAERAAIDNNTDIKEIRYREVGHSEKVDYDNVRLCELRYDASCGKEIFLSYEDVENDVLIGFLRLRIPSDPFRAEITEKSAIVRELHIYGPLVPIGKSKDHAYQHKGFGSKLLKRAEDIAKNEFDKDKIVVISGIGVREYYYKNGYKKDGLYVSKGL